MKSQEDYRRSCLTQEEVCVEAALVGLVQNQDAVGAQQQVALQLAQQDAVRHKLHGCVIADLAVIPHLRMAAFSHCVALSIKS